MAMGAEGQLLTIIYSAVGLATIEGFVIVVAKRDVKLGLKKWWMKKRGQNPIAVQFHGPDKTVTEYIVPTKGKGDVIEIRNDKLFKKDKDGMRFFLDPKAIKRRDDEINQISYNYKTIMPLDPEQTSEEVAEERKKFVQRYNEQKKEEAEKKGDTTFKPLEIDEIIKFTDPKRLNKFVEYNYLAAKTDALKDAQDVMKWVKWGTIAAIAAAGIGVIIYMKVNGDVIPGIAEIKGMLSAAGSTVMHPGAAGAAGAP